MWSEERDNALGVGSPSGLSKFLELFLGVSPGSNSTS